MDHIENTENFDDAAKSKTKIKQEMHYLRVLGKKLVDLNASQLKKIPMSEDLEKAIADAHKIRQREATRRHRQYIGKLLRNEDVDAIEQILELLDSSSLLHAQALHQTETLRDQLISDNNDALTHFIDTHSKADVPHLRQLIRNAKKELSSEKNRGHAKKLFRYLKELL